MLLGALAFVLALAAPAMAADVPSEVALFKNVNIFDGTSEKLLEGQDMLDAVRFNLKRGASQIKILMGGAHAAGLVRLWIESSGR